VDDEAQADAFHPTSIDPIARCGAVPALTLDNRCGTSRRAGRRHGAPTHLGGFGASTVGASGETHDNARMRLTRAASVVAAVASVALSVWIAVADARLDDELRIGWGENGTLLVAAVAIAATGCLIASRSSAPRIGWLLIGLSAALPTYDTLVAHTVEPDGEPPRYARLVIAFTSVSWLVVFALIATLAIVFPDGRPATRRWRNVLRVSVIGWSATIAGITLSEHPASGGRFAEVAGPFPGLETVGLALFVPGYAISIASLPLACAALVTRFRRSEGIERLQLKWLVSAVTLLPLTFLVCIALWALAGLEPEDGAGGELVVGLLFASLVVGVSGAVAIAITRHGLYRIDWIANRTLVYGALTVVLSTGWLGLSFGLGTTLGGRSAWTASLATATVAVAFLPLRRRLQDAVDRRLSRSRYDAVAVIRSLEDAIRDGRAEPEEIERALRDALRDSSAELLLRLPEDGTLVGCDGSSPTEDSSAVRPIIREGQEIGVLRHDPRLAERPETLEAVLAAAGLPIELARLRVELRRQLAEVEESRRRIVRAGYEERRRLERDLHDGAQQRLVGLGIRLRRIQRSLPAEARVLGPALDGAVDEIGLAVDDLRTIAAGVRPARLDDGLAAALADLARGTPLPVDVEVAVGRLSEPIEAAAYYVACEAVTNAVKHASASRIVVVASTVDGHVHVTVRDDGLGGAAPRRSGGLTGLADRLEAHGGTLVVDSPPGGGTSVAAVIPCAS